MPKYARLPDEEAPPSKKSDTEVARKVEKGLRAARAAMSATSIEGLISETNLPALEGNEPLTDLATRLDREADLWRNLAFREMSRMVWSARMITAIALVVVLGDLGLAFIAGVGAFFGVEAGGRSVLVLTASVVITLGLCAAVAVAIVSRRSQREIVQSALARSDLAELRLHRVAIAMAHKKVDEGRYADALLRLERDAT